MRAALKALVGYLFGDDKPTREQQELLDIVADLTTTGEDWKFSPPGMLNSMAVLTYEKTPFIQVIVNVTQQEEWLTATPPIFIKVDGVQALVPRFQKKPFERLYFYHKFKERMAKERQERQKHERLLAKVKGQEVEPIRGEGI